MDPEGRLVGGRYRLLRPLGSGGMGTVWRAEDTLLEREVAVKEVTFPPGTRPEEAEVLRERTRREARSAARLTHPNAVTVFDVVEEDGRPWLVMELVESRTLAQAVREGPLSPGRTARVGLAVLGALEAAHRRGILHRDVKPSNVLLAPARDGQDERAVLTDFGIATNADDSGLTSSGLLLGSPAYIAPERASGQPAQPASDLWALGATLFTAVEGSPPYDGADPLLTVTAVVAGEHAPYVLAGPLVPVLDRLLEKDPARRLDAAGARRMLQEVADLPRAAPPARAPATAGVAAGSGRSAGATTVAPPTAALDVKDVRREVARAAPDRLPRVSRLPAPRRRAALPVAAAVLAVAVLGGGIAVATRGGTSSRAAAPPAAAPSTPAPTPAAVPAATSAPTPAATPAPTTAPPVTTPSAPAPTPPATVAPPAGGAGAVPAGWTTHTAAPGWTAAVPDSYSAVRSLADGQEYRDPASGRLLRVQTGRGQPDAVADRQSQARVFASHNSDYRQIAITPVTYLGLPAADWEFTFAGVHVIDRVFNDRGTGHSLWFQTRTGDAATARAEFDAMLATFRPAGG